LAVETDVEERVSDDDEKQRAWFEGCRREEAICGLLERHGDKRLSMTDVDEMAWELGVSRSTLHRLIAAYRAKRTVSFCRAAQPGATQKYLRVGPQTGKTHLDDHSGDLSEPRTADR